MDENDVSASGFFSWVQTHPIVLLGLGLVVLFILVQRALKTGNQAITGTADTTQPKTIYVPTSTEFYTDNSVNATSAEGAPATVNVGPVNSPVSTSTNSSSSSTTSTTTTTVTPVVTPPPVRTTPVTPAPVTHKGGLSWDQKYSVIGGDNLSKIATNYTTKVRAQGAPSSVSIGWHDLYSHNQSLIDNTARQHGVTVNPYNYIYIGESLIVPRWNKNLN